MRLAYWFDKVSRQSRATEKQHIAASDTYIEKDSSVNDEIDKLRHSTTHSLLTRRDVLVVASVSCIYGLGAPENYGEMHVYVETGQNLVRDELLRTLVDMQYARNDHDFHRGTFRVRGDVVEIFPQYEAERALRVEFFGDEVDAISEIDPLRGKVVLGSSGPVEITDISNEDLLT